MELQFQGIENITIKYFHTLGCTFWDDEEKITKEFQVKSHYIKACVATATNEYDIKNLIVHQEHLDKSYEILTNPKTKEKYFSFLFLNYIFSQPNSLEKLKTNFLNCVFPFYMFVTYSKKDSDDVIFLSLNFITFTVSFNSKGKLIRTVDIESVKSIYKLHGTTVLRLEKKEKIEIIPEIAQQNELIYVLLMFMSREKFKKIEEKGDITVEEQSSLATKDSSLRDKVEIEEGNYKFEELKLLKDEMYLPSGIILKASIFKINKKTYMKNDRYIALGNSNLFIFKDETMQVLCNVIPIIPCYVLFNFDEGELMMKILMVNRKYKIYFKSTDEFQIWRTTIFDLADFGIDERIPDDLLLNGIYNSIFLPNEIETHPLMLHLDQTIQETEEELNVLKAKKEEIYKMFSKKNEMTGKSIAELIKNSFEDQQIVKIQNSLKKTNSTKI